MNDKPFVTSDTSLAAYLLVAKFPLVEIDYSGERFLFTFGNGNTDLEELEYMVNLYQIGAALNNPANQSTMAKRLNNTVRDKRQWGE